MQITEDRNGELQFLASIEQEIERVTFTGDCIRIPTEEPANRFFIYEPRIKSSLRPASTNTTYHNQISPYIQQSGEKSLEVGEKRKMAVN